MVTRGARRIGRTIWKLGNSVELSSKESKAKESERKYTYFSSGVAPCWDTFLDKAFFAFLYDCIISISASVCGSILSSISIACWSSGEYCVVVFLSSSLFPHVDRVKSIIIAESGVNPIFIFLFIPLGLIIFASLFSKYSHFLFILFIFFDFLDYFFCD